VSRFEPGLELIRDLHDQPRVETPPQRGMLQETVDAREGTFDHSDQYLGRETHYSDELLAAVYLESS
jgi:hypothetical protein